MAEVSSVTFQYVLRALQMHTKIPLEEMLEKVTLDKKVLQHEGKINTQKLTDIFVYCMDKTKNRYLALELGQSIPYQSLGILGYLLVNTKTLKEMIEKFNHYQKLVSGHLKFNFYEDEKYYKFTIYINENKYIPVPSFHAEVHLTSILNILSQILGKPVVPEKTYFTQTDGQIENKQRYKDIFGENIKFNEEENSIFFNINSLNVKVNNSNISMLHFFEAQANVILEELKNDTWYSKVEKEILKNIGDTDITIDFVAKNLGLSVRTLQNYLKYESKKFSTALSNVRKKLSKHYIKNSNLDDTSISFLLGYTEISSFYRAYKKWHKQTPKQTRNSL
jgi:AraC-like DNA-binding protein